MLIFSILIYTTDTSVKTTEQIQNNLELCLQEIVPQRYLNDHEISSIHKFSTNLLLYYQIINRSLFKIDEFIFNITHCIKYDSLSKIFIDRLTCDMDFLKNYFSLINCMEDSNISFGIRRCFFCIEKILELLISIKNNKYTTAKENLLQNLENLTKNFKFFKDIMPKMIRSCTEIQHTINSNFILFPRDKESIFSKYIEENLHLFNNNNVKNSNFFAFSYNLYNDYFVPMYQHFSLNNVSDPWSETISNIKFNNTRQEFSNFTQYFINELKILLMSEIFFYNFGFEYLCSSTMVDFIGQMKNIYKQQQNE